MKSQWSQTLRAKKDNCCAHNACWETVLSRRYNVRKSLSNTENFSAADVPAVMRIRSQRPLQNHFHPLHHKLQLPSCISRGTNPHRLAFMRESDQYRSV
ncbi:hypothetical protein GDO78_014123 [Eleutherodactylus coqui]|uniref:Uncharacterized protein n=1 Tax=Eleutherodactylus coqui TaxID=57060 RepID=A0A8J6JXP8_ELECQ|nr:hypothetical protein GDO78_014123 [Eleutherodactylus coqui]